MIPKGLEKAAVVAAIDEWNAGAVTDGNVDRREVTLIIAADQIRETCGFLKEQQQFVRLSNVTAVDWYPAVPRFAVVYHLHSIERNERLRLTCRLDGESPEIDSVTPVWSGADWYEREVYDLFGVRFRGHPNLKRLLLPEEWEGHPLRKDFPVHGHKYSYREDSE